MKEVNLFKERGEDVFDMFKNDTLEFDFVSDNIAHYKTAYPKIINDEYVVIQLSFYMKDGCTLFKHDKFDSLAKENQIYQIFYIPSSLQVETLYFSEYKEV